MSVDVPSAPAANWINVDSGATIVADPLIAELNNVVVDRVAEILLFPATAADKYTGTYNCCAVITDVPLIAAARRMLVFSAALMNAWPLTTTFASIAVVSAAVKDALPRKLAETRMPVFSRELTVLLPEILAAKLAAGELSVPATALEPLIDVARSIAVVRDDVTVAAPLIAAAG